jgi:hypothetical protein
VQLAMRGMPGWGRHARQGGGAHGSGGRRERLTGGCARLWRGAQTGKGRACMGVEGARTANRGAHMARKMRCTAGRGGAWILGGRARVEMGAYTTVAFANFRV